MKLYCLPYAGSSASVYVRWKRRLPAWIEVTPVELPGRGRRMAEPLQETMSGLLEQIASEVRPEPGRPFAIFGHSLGAIVAFELVRRLEVLGTPPAVLFVSGTHSPSTRKADRYAELQTDDELRAELERLDGTPANVLAEPELMQMVLPVLRADFRVAASYQPDTTLTIRSPLCALGGVDDETTGDELVAWRDHTHGEFALHMLPGGHFYIHTEEARLFGIIEERLRLVSARSSQAGSAGKPGTAQRQPRAESRE